MKPLYQHMNLRVILFGLLAPFVLASCGSYQYAGYDHDGIYSDSTPGTVVNETYTQEDHDESYENALYYKQIFSQKAEEFEDIAEQGEIFTDVDSYASGTYQADAYVENGYGPAYGGWGDQADEISINIYPSYFGYSPFFDPYYHPHHSWYGYGYGYGYGAPWYYSPWRHRYGYGSWGYASIGWGFGYNHWGYGSSYYPYYSSYYSSYYRPVRNVAYNNSRRNSASDYRSSGVRSSDLRSTRVRNTSDVRASRSDYTATRRTRVSNDDSNNTYRTYRSRENSPAVRTSRSSRSREYTPPTRTRSQSYEPRVRSSSPTRSSGTYRSSTPTTRSSGTTRSRSSRGGRGN